MRYRIQIEPMLGCTLCVVTEMDSVGGRYWSTTKLYTIDEEIGAHGSLVEVLGQLQRLIAESQD
jgi:hypothetical protein